MPCAPARIDPTRASHGIPVYNKIDSLFFYLYATVNSGGNAMYTGFERPLETGQI